MQSNGLKDIYNYLGGRKVFYFLFLIVLNTLILLFSDKWSDGYGYFTVSLYGVIVIGLEHTKRIRKNGE